MTATLSQITIYPIKSLPGVNLRECRVLPSGALEWDRRFALVDARGEVVSAKRSTAAYGIRLRYDLSVPEVLVESGDSPGQRFHLYAQVDELAAELSRQIGEPVTLAENGERGFPDDTESLGPTIVSSATLHRVAQQFEGISFDEAHRRFRANLIVDGVPAFWEDRLFGAAGETVAFDIGSVTFGGTNPCQRCVVPARSSTTAGETSAFQKRLAQMRKAELPPWADASRFDHYYRLATNTVLLVPSTGDVIRVGDSIHQDSRSDS
ncbi:MAG: MOSC domain-containing protein [Planctomycetota bacterium]|jgi:uncharacterized protein YcbX